MTELSSLHLKICSGESADEEAFSLWEQVWSQTFVELDGISDLCSDNFTRQHEILSLYLDDQCVALVCHRYVNLLLKSSLKDSYFKPWPKATLERLGACGPNVAIGSQITIHPDFRQSRSSLKIKNIITYLSLRCLKEKEVDAVTGVMRADKGMNNLFYECGAEPLLKGISFHNVPVDLLAFFPKRSPMKISSDYEALIDEIWSNKSSINLQKLPHAA